MHHEDGASAAKAAIGLLLNGSAAPEQPPSSDDSLESLYKMFADIDSAPFDKLWGAETSPRSVLQPSAEDARADSAGCQTPPRKRAKEEDATPVSKRSRKGRAEVREAACRIGPPKSAHPIPTPCAPNCATRCSQSRSQSRRHTPLEILAHVPHEASCVAEVTGFLVKWKAPGSEGRVFQQWTQAPKFVRMGDAHASVADHYWRHGIGSF